MLVVVGMLNQIYEAWSFTLSSPPPSSPHVSSSVVFFCHYCPPPALVLQKVLCE